MICLNQSGTPGSSQNGEETGESQVSNIKSQIRTRAVGEIVGSIGACIYLLITV